MLETWSYYTTKAGVQSLFTGITVPQYSLQFLASSHPPTSASQVAETTGMSHFNEQKVKIEGKKATLISNPQVNSIFFNAGLGEKDDKDKLEGYAYKGKIKQGGKRHRIKVQIIASNMNCTHLKDTVISIFLFGKYCQSFFFISWGNYTIRYLQKY